MRFFIVTLTCILVSFFPLQAQKWAEEWRVARKYEQSGEWEKARALYKTLLQNNPKHEEIAKAYVESCIQTAHEQEALPLIDQMLSFSSRAVEWKALRARLLYRLGRKTEAFQEWDEILEKNSKNIEAYRILAQTMIQEKCVNKAIEVYLKARVKLSRPELFSLEIAGLYESQQQYGKATEEWICFLMSNPSPSISLPFFRFPNTPEVRTAVLQAFRKAIKNTSNPIPILQWMMHYSLSVNAFSSAWEAVKALEEKANQKQKGMFLSQFGQIALSQGHWDEAFRAFKEIEVQYSSYSDLSRVFFSLAQLTERKQKFQEAMMYYDKILKKEKNNALAFQAMTEKARLFREKLGDPNGALMMLKALLRDHPSSPQFNSWLLEAGQCALTLGEFASAEKYFQTGLERESKSAGQLTISFLFFLAKSLYFQGKFSQALDTLQALNRSWKNISIYEDPYFNDALALRGFLQKYQACCENPLCFYARAEYFQEQKQFREALASLDSIEVQNPNHPFWVEVYFKRGEIQFQLKMYSQSLSEFSQFLKKAPGHVLADRAMAYQGKIYEQFGNKSLAIETYNRLLARFPQSPMAGEIRERMEILLKGK